jgi:hypothetical protein
VTGPAAGETQRALTGTLLLARGDARGIGCFDASIGGFWRSFRAGAICYPFYLGLTLWRLGAAQAGFRTVLIETIGYVVSWTAFPLIMLNLCRRLDRDDHFLGFMTAYNWCQVPQIVLFSAVTLAEAVGLVGSTVASAAGLAAAAAVLVYEWFIARVALDVAPGAAILVVVVDLLLAAIMRQVDESLY